MDRLSAEEDNADDFTGRRWGFMRISGLSTLADSDSAHFARLFGAANEDVLVAPWTLPHCVTRLARGLETVAVCLDRRRLVEFRTLSKVLLAHCDRIYAFACFYLDVIHPVAVWSNRRKDFDAVKAGRLEDAFLAEKFYGGNLLRSYQSLSNDNLFSREVASLASIDLSD